MIALSDVACDVLVAHEFYSSGRGLYFGLSLVVFALAQLIYSFFFVSTWASHLSSSGRIWAFFLCLPVAQLVPIFSFFEAFHIEWIDRRIRELGLRPRNSAARERPLRGARTAPLSGWQQLQQKHAGASGFMLEALAEAIPQALLQTAALVTAPGGVASASATMQLSIALSVLCVASKGYLVSFSIDAWTYAFNCACVAADVFALFAATAWLFELDRDGAANAAPLPKLLTLPWVAARIYAPALALCALGSGAATAFAVFDDHLKGVVSRRAQRWRVARAERRTLHRRLYCKAAIARHGAGARAEAAARSEVREAERSEGFYAAAEREPADVLGEAAWEEATGAVSFIYRYILRDSCSQFDSLPLTSLIASTASTRRTARLYGLTSTSSAPRSGSSRCCRSLWCTRRCAGRSSRSSPSAPSTRSTPRGASSTPPSSGLYSRGRRGGRRRRQRRGDGGTAAETAAERAAPGQRRG